MRRLLLLSALLLLAAAPTRAQFAVGSYAGYNLNNVMEGPVVAVFGEADWARFVGGQLLLRAGVEYTPDTPYYADDRYLQLLVDFAFGTEPLVGPVGFTFGVGVAAALSAADPFPTDEELLEMGIDTPTERRLFEQRRETLRSGLHAFATAEYAAAALQPFVGFRVVNYDRVQYTPLVGVKYAF